MAEFDTNLMRMVAAELYFLASLQGARELLGKSYLSLSVAEKAAVDQMVLGGIGGNYRAITPEVLKQQGTQQAVGFQTTAAAGAAPAQQTPPSTT
jgi:hypothetical protein